MSFEFKMRKWRGLNLLGKVLNKVREQCVLFYG